MTDWNLMATAPIDRKIDIFAKRWVARTDEFEFKRFVDCTWRGTYFGGCPKDWFPTHWMPVPENPSNIERLHYNTEHKRRAAAAA